MATVPTVTRNVTGDQIQSGVEQDDGDGKAPMGENAGPKILTGLTTSVRAPAAKPTGSSTTIAGIRSLEARI
jgi:hypothetical protein